VLKPIKNMHLTVSGVRYLPFLSMDMLKSGTMDFTLMYKISICMVPTSISKRSVCGSQPFPSPSHLHRGLFTNAVVHTVVHAVLKDDAVDALAAQSCSCCSSLPVSLPRCRFLSPEAHFRASCDFGPALWSPGASILTDSCICESSVVCCPCKCSEASQLDGFMSGGAVVPLPPI